MFDDDWLFSCSWAGLTHGFMLKWYFYWVSRTNKKIRDECRRANNLSLEENGCHASATVCLLRAERSAGQRCFYPLPFLLIYQLCHFKRKIKSADTSLGLTHVTSNKGVIYFLWWEKLGNHFSTRPCISILFYLLLRTKTKTKGEHGVDPACFAHHHIPAVVNIRRFLTWTN